MLWGHLFLVLYSTKSEICSHKSISIWFSTVRESVGLSDFCNHCYIAMCECVGLSDFCNHCYIVNTSSVDFILVHLLFVCEFLLFVSQFLTVCPLSWYTSKFIPVMVKIVTLYCNSILLDICVHVSLIPRLCGLGTGLCHTQTTYGW